MLTLKNVDLGIPPMDEMSEFTTGKFFFFFSSGFTLLINTLEQILILLFKYVLA